MKIYWTLTLLLSIVFSSYAQKKTDSLSYPDLIPILKNGLYGYCDKDKNIIIDPKFELAFFFEKDLSFENIKDPKKKIFGSNAYATVLQNERAVRIDKKGKVVYQFNSEDFNERLQKESMIPSRSPQPYEKFQNDKTDLCEYAIYQLETH